MASIAPAPPEPTLADKVETLRSNLGLDAAGMPQILDKACEQLGLADAKYPNLAAKADACLKAIGDGAALKAASTPSVTRSAEIDAFMKKVGSSLDQVQAAHALGWNGKAINGSDCKVIAYLIASGALAHVTFLSLASNAIGHAGLTALADACAKGALASLENLYVDNEEHAALKAVCHARDIYLR